MSIRYYVSVYNDGHATILNSASDSIAVKIASTMRDFRIETGFDYLGFNIKGITISDSPNLTLGAIVRAVKDTCPDADLEKVRFIISGHGAENQVDDNPFSLLLQIFPGTSFAWSDGTGAIHAAITTSNLGALQQEATILDVFQDIMITNEPCIQAVIKKFLRTGGSVNDFHAKKAAFAMRQVRGKQTLFDTFNASKYASFSSLARSKLFFPLSTADRARLSQLWQQFMIEEMKEWFLTVEEAIHVVRKSGYRDTKTFDNRVNHEDISPNELKLVLSDKRIVTQSGSYILCYLRKKLPSSAKGDAQAIFSRASPSSYRRLQLCTNSTYAAMVDLVRRGFVTPMRLFLQS